MGDVERMVMKIQDRLEVIEKQTKTALSTNG